jgi:hypothetical protein
MRLVTLDLVGLWELSKVALKLIENFPSSSADSSASAKWRSKDCPPSHRQEADPVISYADSGSG